MSPRVYFLLLEGELSLVESRILVEVPSTRSHPGDTWMTHGTWYDGTRHCCHAVLLPIVDFTRLSPSTTRHTWMTHGTWYDGARHCCHAVLLPIVDFTRLSPSTTHHQSFRQHPFSSWPPTLPTLPTQAMPICSLERKAYSFYRPTGCNIVSFTVCGRSNR